MKKAAAALAIVTTVIAQSPAGAQNGAGGALFVSPTTAGLIASAQGNSSGYGVPYFGLAPAIYGYGYQPTYYGNGFSYQPAYNRGQAYYVAPRLQRCCRW